MDSQKAFDYLYSRLKKRGAIDWHSSKYNSRYIKFRDSRIGSIRISDHNGRQKYKYTWEFNCRLDDEKKLDIIVMQAVNKLKNLVNYKPDQYVVYSNLQKKCIKVENYYTYRNYILRKL